MPEGTFAQLEIDAPAEALYDVVADVGAYPEWATGVKTVEVLETDDDGRVSRARFVVDIFVKEIDYVLNYSHDRPNILSWSADESDDLKSLDGSYKFVPVDGSTEVTYSFTVQTKFIIPGFIKRQGEKQIVTTALRGLRKRVTEAG